MHHRICQTLTSHFALVVVLVGGVLAQAQERAVSTPHQRRVITDLQLVPVTSLVSETEQIPRDESVFRRQKTIDSGLYVFADEIRQLRNRARLAAKPPQTTPDGFSVSTVDPADIVAVFTSLRIRPGFVLRGFEDRWGSNGDGFVRAFTLDQPAPLPGAVLSTSARRQVSRAGLNDNPMKAITGDGSAWSYLCASILAREFEKFGARWHGQSWVTHTLLTRDPWNDFPEVKDRSFYALKTSQDKWKWGQEKLTDWRPKVRVGKDVIEVVFYTYSPLGQERIYRHKDTYRHGDYCAKSERTAIASGPQWMVF